LLYRYSIKKRMRIEEDLRYLELVGLELPGVEAVRLG
jgi:hypothetical protein